MPKQLEISEVRHWRQQLAEKVNLITSGISLEKPIQLVEVRAILIGSWHVLFCTDYHILHKLFELCRLIQTDLPHENHVEDFFIAYTHPSKITNFDISFALSE